MSADENLYERAGITDEGDFYRTKFVSEEVLDARYISALSRFDMGIRQRQSARICSRPGLWGRNACSAQTQRRRAHRS